MSKQTEQETFVYAEAANGITVRVPLSQYDEWSKTQDEIRAGKKPEIDPALKEELRRLLLGEK